MCSAHAEAGFFHCPSRRYHQRDATLAQLVERLIRNQQVSGSSPEGGSIFWLLSEKCKRRSGALNPWSCGQGGFGRVTADLGNVAPLPSIFGKLATFFSQKGSSCLVLVNRGARPEHLAHRPANRPEAGGLRHPRIATLGRFLRRNRWLGHPQLLAEAGSYWSWFSRRPRFQRNSFLRRCPVASGLAPSPATQPCPGRMTHQRAPQNPSDRNPLYRKAFNSNYTFRTGTQQSD